jgi:hypothetical protein
VEKDNIQKVNTDVEKSILNCLNDGRSLELLNTLLKMSEVTIDFLRRKVRRSKI